MRKPYEFGVKSAVVVAHKSGLMLGAKTFPGNSYDGHTLNAILQQSAKLTQDARVTLRQVVVDLGFRGVDADHPDKQIIHRGKIKSMNQQQKGWLRRRQAIEPAIGHLKLDNRMDRCWLQGALGDMLHTIGCAAGYNLRWLLRAIAHRAYEQFFAPVTIGRIGSSGHRCFMWHLWPHINQRMVLSQAARQPRRMSWLGRDSKSNFAGPTNK